MLLMIIVSIAIVAGLCGLIRGLPALFEYRDRHKRRRRRARRRAGDA